MSLGVLVLVEHSQERFLFTTPEDAPNDFARLVIEHMTGYNSAVGGSFDSSPLSISFFTNRISVMLIGPITHNLYDAVRQRVNFEINRNRFRGE